MVFVVLQLKTLLAINSSILNIQTEQTFPVFIRFPLLDILSFHLFNAEEKEQLPSTQAELFQTKVQQMLCRGGIIVIQRLYCFSYS